MNLWLDDVRDPVKFGAIGYVWVTSVQEAKRLIATGNVERASLDHDLGACEACMGRFYQSESVAEMPNCEHVGTGYTLCLWMAETGHWPQTPPVVHSMNTVGRERMQGVIKRYWKARPLGPVEGRTRHPKE